MDSKKDQPTAAQPSPTKETKETADKKKAEEQPKQAEPQKKGTDAADAAEGQETAEAHEAAEAQEGAEGENQDDDALDVDLTQLLKAFTSPPTGEGGEGAHHQHHHHHHHHHHHQHGHHHYHHQHHDQYWAEDGVSYWDEEYAEYPPNQWYGHHPMHHHAHHHHYQHHQMGYGYPHQGHRYPKGMDPYGKMPPHYAMGHQNAMATAAQQAAWRRTTRHKAPPAPASMRSSIHVYDVGMTCVVRVQTATIVPTAATTAADMFPKLCVWEAGQTCPHRGQCPHVHVIPGTSLQPSPIHASANAANIPRHPAGRTARVYDPHQRELSAEVPSDHILRTVGSDEWHADPNAGLRVYHCAHFLSKGVCHRGAECTFFHVVPSPSAMTSTSLSSSPNQQQQQQKADAVASTLPTTVVVPTQQQQQQQHMPPTMMMMPPPG
eukprot:PhM_4_TR3452/c3_g1_i1/m.62885